jgi:SnoaL-like domain
MGEVIKDLSAAVQQLVDEAAIRRLFSLYCHRIDEYDVEEQGKLFTENCRFILKYDQEPVAVGREAFKQMSRDTQSVYSQTCHIISNLLMDIDGDTANVSCYAVAWHKKIEDGDTVVVWFRYVDRVVRHGSEWLIDEHMLLAHGIDGKGPVADPDWWEFVPRHPPNGTFQAPWYDKPLTSG